MSLLDERIKEYNIPRWPYQPSFDRVIVYMVPEEMATRDTYAKGGVIVKPETRKAHDKSQTPRAILCAAGLQGMDHLRAHGYRLGDLVWVARLSPWRHVVERTEGGDVEFMFLRSGDFCGSEDTLQFLQSGKMRITVGADGRHQYVVDDDVLARFDPPDFQDM